MIRKCERVISHVWGVAVIGAYAWCMDARRHKDEKEVGKQDNENDILVKKMERRRGMGGLQEKDNKNGENLVEKFLNCHTSANAGRATCVGDVPLSKLANVLQWRSSGWWCDRKPT